MPAQRPTRPSTIQQLSTGTLVNMDPATISRLLSEQGDMILELQRRLAVLAGSTTDALFTSTTDGDVPASGGGTANFLRADGTWVTPAGGGDVSHTRAINTSAPLTGGGDLSADRTLGVNTFGAAQSGVVPLSGGGTTNFLRADGTWQVPPGVFVPQVTVGSATIDFGAGNQRATVTVTGQAAIASGSLVSAFVMGDSTADHNAYEHSMAPIFVTAGNVVAGTGFDIVAVCDWTLHGQFKVRWAWV